MREINMITANDAAAILGVSPDLIRRYVASGRLRAIREGGRIHFPREAAEKLVSVCDHCHVRFVPKAEITNLCPACVRLQRYAK
jgi:excisionase family DNA binding protein